MLDYEFVFITKSNFEGIVYSMRDRQSSESLSNLYESSLDSVLSISEQRLMAAFKRFYQDPQAAIEFYKKTKGEKNPSNKWVFSGASVPAYHCNDACERLVSDYTNIEIPAEIRDRGDLEIARYRAFVSKNQSLLASEPERFAKRLEAHFFLKNPPKTVKYENSGKHLITNYSLSMLKAKIEDLLQQAEQYRHQSPEHKAIIEDLGNNTHLLAGVKSAEETILSIWHHRYKSELKALLKDYFRIRFNPELKFEGGLLEQLNFKPCSCCKNKDG